MMQSYSRLMLVSGEPLTSRLYLGNALDILPTLPDESVDLLLTDPPYGINYVSKSKSLALRKIANDTGKEAYDLLDKVLAVAAKKLKPNSHVFIFTNFQAYEFMAPYAIPLCQDKNRPTLRMNSAIQQMDAHHAR